MYEYEIAAAAQYVSTRLGARRRRVSADRAVGPAHADRALHGEPAADAGGRDRLHGLWLGLGVLHLGHHPDLAGVGPVHRRAGEDVPLRAGGAERDHRGDEARGDAQRRSRTPRSRSTPVTATATSSSAPGGTSDTSSGSRCTTWAASRARGRRSRSWSAWSSTWSRSSQFPERKIHIRLEDTIVLTEKGPENLTAAVPAELEPLYALIKAEGRQLDGGAGARPLAPSAEEERWPPGPYCWPRPRGPGTAVVLHSIQMRESVEKVAPGTGRYARLGMREARLRPEFAHLYPELTPGQWEPASRIAEVVLAHFLLQQMASRPDGARAPGIPLRVPRRRAGRRRGRIPRRRVDDRDRRIEQIHGRSPLSHRPLRLPGRRRRRTRRLDCIARIAAAPAELRAAVAGLTDAQLDTPYRDGGLDRAPGGPPRARQPPQRLHPLSPRAHRADAHDQALPGAPLGRAARRARRAGRRSRSPCSRRCTAAGCCCSGASAPPTGSGRYLHPEHGREWSLDEVAGDVRLARRAPHRARHPPARPDGLELTRIAALPRRRRDGRLGRCTSASHLHPEPSATWAAVREARRSSPGRALLALWPVLHPRAGAPPPRRPDPSGPATSAFRWRERRPAGRHHRRPRRHRGAR